MKILHYKFVDFIPEELEGDILYISLEFKTAIHLCPCGCGNQVVTPFSPTDWKLIFDGDSVSLYPSIGSWALPCKSHYWIKNNKIEWAPLWHEREISKLRKKEKKEKKKFFKKSKKKLIREQLF